MSIENPLIGQANVSNTALSILLNRLLFILVDLVRITIWDVVCCHCKQLVDDDRIYGNSHGHTKTITPSRSFVSDHVLDEL